MNRLETIGAAEAAPHASPAMPDRALPNNALPSRTMLCQAAPTRDEASYHRKMARVLDHMGATHTLQDILTAIAEGRMQSFVEGNSWAITQVNAYPRARTLQLVAMVGDLADVDALHAQILAYADKANCSLLSTYGRLGWLREGSFRRLGWRLKAKNYLYHRDM